MWPVWPRIVQRCSPLMSSKAKIHRIVSQSALDFVGLYSVPGDVPDVGGVPVELNRVIGHQARLHSEYMTYMDVRA